MEPTVKVSAKLLSVFSAAIMSFSLLNCSGIHSIDPVKKATSHSSLAKTNATHGLYSGCYNDEFKAATYLPKSCRTSILMYHEVTSVSPQKLGPTALSNSITITQFQKHMDLISDAKIQTITPFDLENCLQNHENADPKSRRPLPAKSVMLTFDDGYVGNYKNVLPYLIEKELKGQFFIHTSYVGSPQSEVGGKISTFEKGSWDNWKETEQSGFVSVHVHTATHANLVSISNSPEKLAKELVDSKATMEKMLGTEKRYMAYPYGAHNAAVVDAVKKAGYHMAFSVNPNSGGAHITEQDKLFYSLPRLGINRGLTDLCFKDALYYE